MNCIRNVCTAWWLNLISHVRLIHWILCEMTYSVSTKNICVCHQELKIENPLRLDNVFMLSEAIWTAYYVKKQDNQNLNLHTYANNSDLNPSLRRLIFGNHWNIFCRTGTNGWFLMMSSNYIINCMKILKDVSHWEEEVKPNRDWWSAGSRRRRERC